MILKLQHALTHTLLLFAVAFFASSQMLHPFFHCHAASVEATAVFSALEEARWVADDSGSPVATDTLREHFCPICSGLLTAAEPPLSAPELPVALPTAYPAVSTHHSGVVDAFHQEARAPPLFTFFV